MTDRRPLPVAAIAGALFCVVLIYLALQVRAGADPAIGAGHQAAKPARQVIVRRVILRRIVEVDPAPAAAGGGAPAAVGGAAPAGGAGAAPAAAAPAASAPAPAAAPAPAPAAAPAPAPVSSGGS